jgi:catechol 2,3-dioxygenase-like lactoylglutathione lyase family enzyme
MITGLDHLVLTVRDIETTCRFYADALGMEVRTFGGERKALHFGAQKINLHPHGNEFEPKANSPTPGSADLCFITHEPVREMVTRLQQSGINIESGPIKRTGATTELLSVYIRDPDGNLLEIANEIHS